ncbi:hypothetical protein B0J11DRAFT_281021 [Dendryphion nanum]|uniref:Uncharacterized protein n=1 Tax=Dendryphion nanum TaxID=256645 RepID=A0A9P9DY23_9PLEO|nr:hypothetical protein B0J11DRAFT_281021 [Dendryphion nanum]
MATEVQNIDQVVFADQKVASVTVAEAGDDDIICAFPVSKPVELPISQTQIFKEFACEYPTVDPNVVRVSQPLPFPDKLQDVIAWTDAFVDRIASLTLQQGKIDELNVAELKRLTTENENLHNSLEATKAELKKSGEETRKANQKAEETKKAAELAATKAKAALQAQVQKAKDAEARAARETVRANKNQEEATRVANKLNAKIKELENLKKIIREISDAARVALDKFQHEQEHHEEDHKTLDRLRNELEKAVAENHALENKLSDILGDLAEAKIDLETKEALILALTSTISDMHGELGLASQKIDELNQKLIDITGKLTDAESQLEIANKAVATLSSERDTALSKIAALSLDLKTANEKIDTLNTNIQTLTTEKDSETAEKLKALAELETQKTIAADLTTKLSTALGEITTINVKLEVLRTGLKRAQTERDAANVARDTAEKGFQEERNTHKEELDATKLLTNLNVDDLKNLQTENGQLKEQLDVAKDLAGKRLVPHGRPGKRVNILSVEYGGRSYETNQKVLDKLYEHAENGTSFQISNGFFEGDPWHGVTKTASITYLVAEGGAPHHIVAVEGKQAKFD